MLTKVTFSLSRISLSSRVTGVKKWRNSILLRIRMTLEELLLAQKVEVAKKR
jgi:hypothetical protein